MKKKTVIRRIAILLLVLAFALLGACGDDKEASEKEKKPSKKTEQSADEDSSEEKSEKKKSKKKSSKKSDDTEDNNDESSESKAEQMLKKKGSEKNSDEAEEESSPETAGAAFFGDWEGMTILTDSKGQTKEGKYRITDDYIIGTYARIKPDEEGNVLMDMVGITIPQLNFSIDSAVYDAATDTLAISGKMGGGTFDTVLDAPGADGVLSFEGRTNGDVKSNYAVYMKRLDSEWDRSDAPKIADKEYNIYVGKNMKQHKGKSLEERVASYTEVGMDVDMSDFLK